MNTLREALQEYLELRRGLGFKMHDAVLQLPRFVVKAQAGEPSCASPHDRDGPSPTGY